MSGFWTTLGDMRFKSTIPFFSGLVLGFLLNLWLKSNITFEEIQSLIQMVLDAL